MGLWGRISHNLMDHYGWTREYVLDLPIASVRLFLASIRVHEKARRKEQAYFIEWQTKVLGGLIVNSSKAEDKTKKKMLDDLGKQRVFDEDAKQAKRKQRQQEAAPVDTSPAGMAELEDIIENGSKVAAERNQMGSFEAMSSRFGGR
jgi:hypothetical protein